MVIYHVFYVLLFCAARPVPGAAPSSPPCLLVSVTGRCSVESVSEQCGLCVSGHSSHDPVDSEMVELRKQLFLLRKRKRRMNVRQDPAVASPLGSRARPSPPPPPPAASTVLCCLLGIFVQDSKCISKTIKL